MCNFWLEMVILGKENKLSILDENYEDIVDLINETNDAAHYLAFDNRIIIDLKQYAFSKLSKKDLVKLFLKIKTHHDVEIVQFLEQILNKIDF